jgi:hypothetical protein
MGRNQSKPEWAIDQSSTFEFLKSKPAISPNNFFCATLSASRESCDAKNLVRVKLPQSEKKTQNLELKEQFYTLWKTYV